MVVEEHPGLTALGPGEMFWLSLRPCYEKMEWISHDLCVEYEDVAGRKWRSGLTLKRKEGEGSFSVEGLFCENITLRVGAMRRLREWFRSRPREKESGGLSGK